MLDVGWWVRVAHVALHGVMHNLETDCGAVSWLASIQVQGTESSSQTCRCACEIWMRICGGTWNLAYALVVYVVRVVGRMRRCWMSGIKRYERVARKTVCGRTWHDAASQVESKVHITRYSLICYGCGMHNAFESRCYAVSHMIVSTHCT